MDDTIWNLSITDSSAPPWPCPHCHTGVLVLVKDSIKHVETVASAERSAEPGWSPDDERSTFSCWLKCSVATCEEEVAVIGRGVVEAEMDHEGDYEWVHYYLPKSAWPMPDVFRIHPSCPSDVSKELRASFRLIWSDRNAAAGRLRVALERLLTAVGVKERVRTPGKIITLSLHERIVRLEKKQPTIAGHLMAVKWFGNTGAHYSNVSLDDLLAAYGIMEHALDELVNKRAKQVAALAKSLTARHRSRRRRSTPGKKR